jgi:hypothetical protein
MTTDNNAEPINWELTTWEGARREQLRRWAEMPLRDIILALEEMQVVAERLSSVDPTPTPAAEVKSGKPGPASEVLDRLERKYTKAAQERK